MSYSTADEKYRKYEGLLRKEPSNSLYKRKLEKYKALSAKSSQRGGNGSNPNQNPFAEPITPPNDTKHDSLAKSQSQAKTGDLVNKIHNMLAYAQQNGATMEGGAKKRSNESKDPKKHKTQVKGYRDMVGGVIDFGAPDFDPNTQIALLNVKKPAQNLKELTETQTLLSKKILASVGTLSTSKSDLEREIERLKALVTSTGTEKEKIQLELNAKIEELRVLQEAHDELVKTGKGADLEQKKRIEELLAAAEEQKKLLEAETKKLEEALEAAKLKEQEHAQAVQILEQKIETIGTQANAVIDKMTLEQNALTEDFDKQAKMYTDSMADLTQKLAALGIKIA